MNPAPPGFPPPEVRLDDTPSAWAPVVVAERLRLRAGRRRTAVAGLDLSLGRGVHGVLGPNGAGKTTLLRALATVIRPAGGRLALLGTDVTGAGADLPAIRRRIGYLPQALGFYPRHTAWEFVDHVAWLNHVPGDVRAAAVERALDRVGLAGRADDRMKALSGGMQRRVGIAQAIVADPDLLILDEPTTGLDPEQRVEFRALLRDLGADTCVVVATHLVEDVVHACDDVLVLDEGALRFCGPVRSLLDAAGDVDPDGALSGAEQGYRNVLRGIGVAA